MTELIKPIPNSALHDQTDETLEKLVTVWRDWAKKGEISESICKELVDDVYKVLGYRCAIEYIKRYGD